MVQFGVDHLTQIPLCCYYYSCPNCKSCDGFKIRRHKIDNVHFIQLKSCNSCHFNWKEIWSSYSQSIWSLQYKYQQESVYNNQQQEVHC